MTGLGTALAVGAIGQGVGGILGNVIGGFASAADREKAEAAFKKAMAEIEAIGAGPDLSREIFLKEFKQVGVLTPEVEKAVDQGVARVAEVDPGLKKAQMSALADIMQVGKTGITAKERLQRQLASEEAARAVSSAEAGQIAQLRARGLAGSAAERTLLGRSADERARREYELAAQTAMAAESRALQAMIQGGQFAGQIRGQEFSEGTTNAQIKNEMDRFNITNRSAQEQRRVAMENQARQYNAAVAQDIHNKNIIMPYQEKVRQRNAEQQMRQNQLTLAQLRSGMYGQQSQMAQQQAAQTQQMWGQMGGAFGQLAGVGLGMYGQGAGWFSPGTTTADLVDRGLSSEGLDLLRGNSPSTGFYSQLDDAVAQGPNWFSPQTTTADLAAKLNPAARRTLGWNR
jgi:hypothetical protein